MKYPGIEAEKARLGMTQSDLAKAINVSELTYRNWQNGKTDMPSSKVIAMAKLFQVSTDYLLNLDTAPST